MSESEANTNYLDRLDAITGRLRDGNFSKGDDIRKVMSLVVDATRCATELQIQEGASELATHSRLRDIYALGIKAAGQRSGWNDGSEVLSAPFVTAHDYHTREIVRLQAEEQRNSS